MHLPIIHSTNVNVFNRRAVELQLANRSDVAYYAERTVSPSSPPIRVVDANSFPVNIGTPAQPVFVQLDTGSFELWVNPQCSSLSFSDASFCEMTGSYSPTRSSTSDDLRTNKFLQYGIGQANVTYFKDTINIPGSSKLTVFISPARSSSDSPHPATTLKQVQFGVAFATKDQFAGILGIGYGLGFTTTYPNFLDQLALQNATKVKAFSLALGSKDAQEGVIVFGGVDTAKFSGPLARLPIIPANESPDGVPRYWVQLDSVTLTPASGKTLPAYANSSMPVFLDSGSTMTLLPTALADAIASDFGSAGVDADGFYQVQCDLTGLSGSLDFMFNGTIVKVPYSEMIRTVDSPPSCFLGIMPSDSFTLLGDTFLRSAYGMFFLMSCLSHGLLATLLRSSSIVDSFSSKPCLIWTATSCG